MVYPSATYRLSAGQGRFAGQRPTFYHCATQPTGKRGDVCCVCVSVCVCVCVCRQMECERVTLHKHLFLSYVLNGLCWILYYTLAALNVAVLQRNPVLTVNCAMRSLLCSLVSDQNHRQRYVLSSSPGGGTGARFLFTMAGLFTTSL